MKDKTYYVYIASNERDTVLYTGVTNDIARRMYEHKNGLTPGFATKYRITKLVFYESTNDVESAIAREKQIKAGSRKRKLQFIENQNPEWNDLSTEWD